MTEVTSSPQAKLSLVCDGERLRVDESCRSWLENSFGEPVFNAGLPVFKVTEDMTQLGHVSTGQKSRMNVAPQEGMRELDLFICHSTADADIAEAIILLFEKGLKLSAKAIPDALALMAIVFPSVQLQIKFYSPKCLMHAFFWLF